MDTHGRRNGDSNGRSPPRGGHRSRSSSPYRGAASASRGVNGSPHTEPSSQDRQRKRRTGWDQPSEDPSTPQQYPALYKTDAIQPDPSQLVPQKPPPSVPPMVSMEQQQKYVNAQLCRIYVGSLDYSLTEDDIRQVFSAFGQITCVDMPKEPAANRSKGFCFVEYASRESAEIALTSMQGFTLKGRTIKVGRPTVTGVSNGPSSMNQQSQMFNQQQSMQYGVQLPPYFQHKAMPSPQSALPMSSHALSIGAIAAASLLQNKGALVTPTNPQVSPSAAVFPATAAKSQTPQHSAMSLPSGGMTPLQSALLSNGVVASAGSTNSIIVQNVPNNFQAEDLQQIFKVFGIISSCRLIPVDKASIGCITYGTTDEAQMAAQTMHHFDVAGSKLSVSFAHVSAPSSSPASVVPSPTASPPTRPSTTNAAANSNVILMTNMVEPNEEDDDLRDEVMEECNKYGQCQNVVIKVIGAEVRIFGVYMTPEEAKAAVAALNGRWFGGRQISCRLYSSLALASANYSQ